MAFRTRLSDKEHRKNLRGKSNGSPKSGPFYFPCPIFILHIFFPFRELYPAFNPKSGIRGVIEKRLGGSLPSTPSCRDLPDAALSGDGWFLKMI